MDNSQHHLKAAAFRLTIAFLSILFIPAAFSAPMIYTFEGQITSLIERPASVDNGIDPHDFFSVNDAVHYSFLIDYDAPGSHTQFDGDTFPIHDFGLHYNYFYAELLYPQSSQLLPLPNIGSINPNADAQKNYGLNFDLAPGNAYTLYSESYLNPFQVWSTTIAFPDWVVGTQVAGLQKALIFPGNSSYTDIVNMQLTLTSVNPVAEPTTMALMVTDLGFLLTRRRDRET